MKEKRTKLGILMVIIGVLMVVGGTIIVMSLINSEERKYDKLMKTAEELQKEESYKAAVKAAEEALEIKEDDEDAKELLVDIYKEWIQVCREEGDEEKAEKLLEEIAEITGEMEEEKEVVSTEKDPVDNTQELPDALPQNTEVPAEETEGQVLNIYCWDMEFREVMEKYYPDYVAIDDYSGTIGDVKVLWNIKGKEDNWYWNNLDSSLLDAKCGYVEDDKKVDIFLVDEENIHKYVNSYYTMPLEALGIEEGELSQQYNYLKEMAMADNGSIRGLAWEGCPGGLLYNREIAKEVLGTDEPETVQEYVKDWESFLATAGYMKNYGYQMVSTVDDMYRMYYNNATTPWAIDGKINIDPQMIQWVNNSKTLVDMGAAGTHEQWSEEWEKGFYPEGKVFCYFVPLWVLEEHMDVFEKGSVGNTYGWGIAEGPQGFFWGGTWMCVSQYTDNETLVKDILLTLTTDGEVMWKLITQDDRFANNKQLIQGLVDYENRLLAFQNPLGILHTNATRASASSSSAYNACSELFMNAMRPYFRGEITLEEALDLFYRYAMEWFPELTK